MPRSGGGSRFRRCSDLPDLGTNRRYRALWVLLSKPESPLSNDSREDQRWP
jgi:hypothetical protein